MSNLRLSKLYMLSYVILMMCILVGNYNAYHSLVMETPFIISLIGNMGIVLFCLIQFVILFFNLKNINRFLISFFVFIMLFFALIGLRGINMQMFVLLLSIINSNYLNFDNYIKKDLYIRAIWLILIFSMYFFHLFPSGYDFTLYRDGVVRQSLGFSHPNTLGSFYLYFLISLIIFILSKNTLHKLTFLKKIFSTIFIFLSGYYIEFIITGSRSAQVALFIIFIGWIISLFHDFRAPKPFWGCLIMILLIFLWIYVIEHFDPYNSLYNYLNQLSSNRLFFQHAAATKYGIYNIFGNNSFLQGNPFWVDNQYILNLISMGIVGELIYVYIFTIVLKNYHILNNFMFSIIIIAIIFQSSFDATGIQYISMLPLVYSFISINNNLRRS